MGQPFIKFIAHTTGYLIFIGLVISQILRIDYDYTNVEKLSTKFPQYYKTFLNYTKNETMKFGVFNSDLVFRAHAITIFDYICMIWIIG